MDEEHQCPRCFRYLHSNADNYELVGYWSPPLAFYGIGASVPPDAVPVYRRVPDGRSHQALAGGSE